MKSKIDRKILLIVSCIWFLAALIPFLLVLHNLKFPVIENVFPLIIIFILPILGIVFSVLPDRFIKPAIYVILILCFIVYFIYILFATFGFEEYRTPFYPVSASATNDTSDYLVLDDLGEERKDVLMKVFPQKIPLDATDADYSYECQPFKFAWCVSASWCLPEEQYKTEEERIAALSKNKIEKDKTVYYDVSTEESYCHVGFFSDEHRVEYVNILGYDYDYRKISGIGDE